MKWESTDVECPDILEAQRSRRMSFTIQSDILMVSPLEWLAKWLIGV